MLCYVRVVHILRLKASFLILIMSKIKFLMSPSNLLRMCQLHKAMTGGVNGILIGAGQAELPWSTKRHVPQTPRSDYTRPGALVTDGHGTVQWAGLERKKQNLVHSSLDAHAVSPRRNVLPPPPHSTSQSTSPLLIHII